jgi:hypothetical protein
MECMISANLSLSLYFEENDRLKRNAFSDKRITTFQTIIETTLRFQTSLK